MKDKVIDQQEKKTYTNIKCDMLKDKNVKSTLKMSKFDEMAYMCGK